MLWSDTAVDNADDYALAVQFRRTTQTNGGIEQPEEIGTEVSSKRAHLVFPDAQHFVHMFDLVGLRRCHTRGEAVQGVAITVNWFDARTGACNYIRLFSFQALHMRLDSCVVFVERG